MFDGESLMNILFGKILLSSDRRIVMQKAGEKECWIMRFMMQTVEPHVDDPYFESSISSVII